ncbi:MAG: DinB family protein [Bacteroidota bacterium]
MKNPLPITQGEYPSFYETYVSKVIAAYEHNPWQAFRVQAEELPDWLEQVPEEKQQFRYEEGKWSVREVIGHMTDAERIFGIRALHFARQEGQALIGFDEKAYVQVANFDDLAWSVLLNNFRTARLANLAMFETFEDSWWENQGTASGASFTLGSMPYIMVGHVLHHVHILRERYGL